MLHLSAQKIDALRPNGTLAELASRGETLRAATGDSHDATRRPLGARRGTWHLKHRVIETPAVLLPTSGGGLLAHLTTEHCEASLAESALGGLVMAWEHVAEALVSNSFGPSITPGPQSDSAATGRKRPRESANGAANARGGAVPAPLTDAEFRSAVKDVSQLLHGKALKGGVRAFAHVPADFPVIMRLRDPRQTFEHAAFMPDGLDGGHPVLASTDAGAACLTGAGNQRRVGPVAYATTAAAVLQPDAIVAMADTFHQRVAQQPLNAGKRVRRAVERGMNWLSETLSAVSELPEGLCVPVLAEIGGYDDVRGRLAAAAHAAQFDNVEGFLVPVAHLLPTGKGGEFDALKLARAHRVLSNVPEQLPLDDLLAVTLPCLPNEKPVLVTGLSGVDEMLHAVSLGADIVSADWLPSAVDSGTVLLFGADGDARSSLAIGDEVFFSDMGPLEAGCGCVICSGSRATTRSYVHHLYAASEMLGKVYVMRHNLYVLDLWVRRLRERLDSASHL